MRDTPFSSLIFLTECPLKYFCRSICKDMKTWSGHHSIYNDDKFQVWTMEEIQLDSTIVTARIRRMTEGNIFSLSTLAGGRGGGGSHPVNGRRGTPSFLTGERYPILPDGGTPILPVGGPQSFLMMGGTSIYLIGGTPIGTRWGTPPPSGLDGVFPSRTGLGYLPSGLDGGSSHQHWMGVPPSGLDG